MKQALRNVWQNVISHLLGVILECKAGLDFVRQVLDQVVRGFAPNHLDTQFIRGQFMVNFLLRNHLDPLLKNFGDRISQHVDKFDIRA